jgi:hypothetical protein
MLHLVLQEEAKHYTNISIILSLIFDHLTIFIVNFAKYFKKRIEANSLNYFA